jgi:hypothetical protein
MPRRTLTEEVIRLATSLGWGHFDATRTSLSANSPAPKPKCTSGDQSNWITGAIENELRRR